MRTVAEVVGVVFLAGGLLLATIGLYGMLRHPGIFDQLHAAGLVTGPAIVLILAASIATGRAETITSAVLVMLFVLVTSPLSGHAIAQAARRRTTDPGAAARDNDRGQGEDEPVRPLVLCAVGKPEQSPAAVAAARVMAAELGARLHLVHVFDPMSVGVPPAGEVVATGRETGDFIHAARIEAEHRLADAAALLEDFEHDAEVREGDLVAELIESAREHRASLIVAAPGGKDAIQWFLRGSVSAQLAAAAPCPVLVAAEGVEVTPGPVLCGFDGSEHGDRAAAHAAQLAAALGQELLLARVGDDGDDAVVRDAAAALAASDGEPELRVRGLSARGDPAAELVRLAREHGASMIATGTRGRGPLASALLGSVSAELVRLADRPVLLVPVSVDD